jgi:hypothetical protein
MEDIKYVNCLVKVRTTSVAYSPEAHGNLNGMRKTNAIKNISAKDLSRLILVFHNACMINTLEERGGIMLPCDVGTIQAVGIKTKKSILLSKVQKPLSNLHTDGYVYKLIKRQHTQLRTNKEGLILLDKVYESGNYFDLDPSKDFRRLLHEKIMSGNFGNILKLDGINANN